jgi:hypothetical protein
VLWFKGAIHVYLGFFAQHTNHCCNEHHQSYCPLSLWAACLSQVHSPLVTAAARPPITCCRVQRPLQLAAAILLALLLGYAYGQQPSHELNGDKCWIVMKRSTWAAVVDLLSALLQLAVLIACFVLLQRPQKPPTMDQLSTYLLVDENGNETEEEATEETEEIGVDLELDGSAPKTVDHQISYRDQLFIILEMLCAGVRTGVTLFQMTSTVRSGIYVQVRTPLWGRLRGVDCVGSAVWGRLCGLCGVGCVGSTVWTVWGRLCATRFYHAAVCSLCFWTFSLLHPKAY